MYYTTIRRFVKVFFSGSGAGSGREKEDAEKTAAFINCLHVFIRITATEDGFLRL